MQEEACDPVTGLSPKEKSLVKKSWDDIKSNWKKDGPEFFIFLFDEYPKVKAYFEFFNGLTNDQIRQSPKLKAHALNFKHGISSFIESIDEPEILIVLIQKLTANHFRRMIDVERFEEAFNAFMKFLTRDNPMDPEISAAWTKTLKVIASVIGGHMAELAKNQNGEK